MQAQAPRVGSVLAGNRHLFEPKSAGLAKPLLRPTTQLHSLSHQRTQQSKVELYYALVTPENQACQQQVRVKAKVRGDSGNSAQEKTPGLSVLGATLLG